MNSDDKQKEIERLAKKVGELHAEHMRLKFQRKLDRDELFRDSDMRRLMELAHKQAPRETEMLLSYLGQHRLMGDLRDSEITGSRQLSLVAAASAPLPS